MQTFQLSPRQQRFVAEYLASGNGTRAAVRAGYGRAGSHVAASRLLKNDKVLAAVDSGRRELAARHEITRDRVIEELEQAIEIAKAKGDAGAMIAGWREIAKICGYYAAEKSLKVDVNIAAKRVIGQLEALSDVELAEIIENGSGLPG